jgi:hypothetical protein
VDGDVGVADGGCRAIGDVYGGVDAEERGLQEVGIVAFLYYSGVGEIQGGAAS